MNRKSTTFPAHVSLDTIAKETGRNLRQWLKLIVEHNETGKDETECVQLLVKDYGISQEWAKYLCSKQFNFETELSKADKSFYSSVTQTFPLAIHVLEEYFTDESLRRSWLGDQIDIEEISTGKNIKLNGIEEGKVQANFNGKGPEKCQLTIQHFNLTGEEDANEMKQFWKNKLSLLSKLFMLND